MDIELMQKYAPYVNELFTYASLTASGVNNQYEFVKANAIKVLGVPSIGMGDYTHSGEQRYGAPCELTALNTELTVRRDRAFTFSVDKCRTPDHQVCPITAGRALSRQINEKVIPEIDKYRLEIMALNAGHKTEGALTVDNAYELFLDATLYLAENKIQPENRVAFVSPAYYKAIKLDPNYIRAGEISQSLLVRGQVGVVDGVSIVLTPDAYLPEGVLFILTHPSATIGAQQLCEYKVHENPPGLNGWLIEGRVCYDAIVLENKKNGIYVLKYALGSITT